MVSYDELRKLKRYGAIIPKPIPDFSFFFFLSFFLSAGSRVCNTFFCNTLLYTCNLPSLLSNKYYSQFPANDARRAYSDLENFSIEPATSSAHESDLVVVTHQI